MEKYADYIKEIEIDSLWSGTRHIVWRLHKQVNVLSGVNGMGKSTILNRVVKCLPKGGDNNQNHVKGVHITMEPEDATCIRYDIIRSFDRPLLNAEIIAKLGLNITTELDFQLYQLQRRYLDYQVDIGNRIIHALQSGAPDAARVAQAHNEPKRMFQDMIDRLFAETGKTPRTKCVSRRLAKRCNLTSCLVAKSSCWWCYLRCWLKTAYPSFSLWTNPK